MTDHDSCNFISIYFYTRLLFAISKIIVHADHTRNYISFYRWLCFRKFLYSLQKSIGMALGKLLVDWWFIFMAYCSTYRSLAYYSGFCRNNWRNRIFYPLLHFLFWLIMGHWRVDLWAGCTLSWRGIGQQYHTRALHGVWLIDTGYIL